MQVHDHYTLCPADPHSDAWDAGEVQNDSRIASLIVGTKALVDSGWSSPEWVKVNPDRYAEVSRLYSCVCADFEAEIKRGEWR
jgi:hypothetical protein